MMSRNNRRWQVVQWGTADMFNPTNNLNAPDLEDPLMFGESVANEMVRHISQVTGALKYAHAEVGFIDSIRSDRPILSGKRAERRAGGSVF